LRQEKEILRKQQLLRLGGDPVIRFRFIAAEKAHHPISLMCSMLGGSRSGGFYAWERRAPSDRALGDAWLAEQIKTIHESNRRVYGSPRVHAELRLAHGIRVRRTRVERALGAGAQAAWPHFGPYPRRPRRRRSRSPWLQTRSTW
jgi:hypothetical protein